MSNRDALTRLRYRYIPDHVIGELLAKRWMDNAIPFLALVIVLIVFGSILPDFYSISNITDLSRQFAETGLVVLGLTIVMLSGGIDLSVGSVFGLAVLTASICMNVWDLGVGLTFLACMAVGIVCGAINGILVGYLRLRAFLTTLVTLIVFRSIYELVFPGFSTAIVANIPEFADLGLHRQRRRVRRTFQLSRDRHHRLVMAPRALPHAARLAVDGRRRRPPVGS